MHKRYQEAQRAKNKSANLTLQLYQEIMMSDIPHAASLKRLSVTELANNSKSMNDDIRHQGMVLRPNGEFRAPRLGEYFLTPKNMEVIGPAVETTKLFNTPEVGFSRVILKIIKITEVTEFLLTQVMLGEKFVTIRCTACECNGDIGNLYWRRSSDNDGIIEFLHTGNSYPFAYLNIQFGGFDWDDNFDPNDMSVITVTDEDPTK